ARIQVDCDGLGLGNFLEFPNVDDPYSSAPITGLSAIAADGNGMDARQNGSPASTISISTEKMARGNGTGVVLPSEGRSAGLSHFNGLGGFNDNHEYEIRLEGNELPPAPWVNVIGNTAAGFIISDSGTGATWTDNSYFFRLTPWFNDPVRDPSGECIYLRDEDTGELWTPTPEPIREASRYTVKHGAGYSTFEHAHNEVRTLLRAGVPESDPLKIQVLAITNNGSTHKRISVTSYLEWVLGTDREKTQVHVRTEMAADGQVMLARNYFDSTFSEKVAFFGTSAPVSSFTAARREFIGRNGTLSAPAALGRQSLSGDVGDTIDPCGALQCVVDIAPGETREIVVLLGTGNSTESALALFGRYGKPDAANAALDHAARAWRARLGRISVKTPDPSFDVILNQWALYQALSCRMWARSAVYQSSGAFGFRDQLQDVMAFAYSEPDIAREHIVRCAGRQFEEGDVQHWWHPQSGRGVRTRFSDDLVWLPYVLNHYISLTGERSVLDVSAPYLKMRQLNADEHEVYDLPEISAKTGSVYEHCLAALRRACTSGEHGLPLIGVGDWNDGMNRVGFHGRGESVWLAWFLIVTLRKFAEHAEIRGDRTAADELRANADRYNDAVETAGWDGEWYRRAYYDDGAPLGSRESDDCKIDSIAQSWSVISRAARPERAALAMRSLNEHLVREDARLIMLLSPPFTNSSHDPGYIQGYLPGVRENGAQYTHAAIWAVLATALQGDGDRAMHLYQMINPVSHALTPEDVATYKVEPFVVAADVYTTEGHLGRGGWTWYTGSASWLYRVGLEAILGFTKRGDSLEIDPCIPSSWREFSIEYRHGSSTYSIDVQNPAGVQHGVRSVIVDGTEVSGPLALASDDQRHHVTVTLGPPSRSPQAE
ncbi:MAG TPA: hypothetical protein VHM24_04905, partial [Gemmatimonadaceae bacterium]|nr:hypothetical protein [Gemmatimonadaceae bacterium]